MFTLVSYSVSGIAGAGADKSTRQGGDAATAGQRSAAGGPPALEVLGAPPARSHVAVEWHRRADSQPVDRRERWEAFLARTGPGWDVVWDADTDVPLWIVGPGLPAPRSVSSGDAAARFARAFLADNLDLLAPGSRADDLVIVANLRRGRVRTVAMVQHHAGLRVVGGQVSFRFVADRLVAVTSEALPFVRVPGLRSGAVSPAAAASAAVASMTSAALAADARAGAVDGPVVLPIVRSGRSGRSGQSGRTGPGHAAAPPAPPVEFRLVMSVAVDARAPAGDWRVYVDAGTGQVVAREQRLRFGAGAVRYNAPVRRPGGARVDYPASAADMTANGADVTSDGDGAVAWPGDGPAQLLVTASGPRVHVVNATGVSAMAARTLAPGETAVWDARAQEILDAQVTAFVHAQIALDRARALAPDLPGWDEPLAVTVNLDDSCNAFTDGTELFFMRSSASCENTARLADVIYHELGHVLHKRAIIPGAGRYERALGEGLADYFAATITGDSGVGVGFFFGDEPLRDIDPPDREHTWPADIGEAHATGLIFAGAMWDLRQHLMAAHGQDAGAAIADELFYAVVQRASSIPGAYVELLVADDDDGDLTNGSPNECAIRDIFGRRHGLSDLGLDRASLSVEPPARDGYDVSVALRGAPERCPAEAVASASLFWGVRGSDTAGDQLAEEIPMAVSSDGLLATIPQQPDGTTVRYRIEVTLAGGERVVFPDNPGDPAYELYVGDVVPLYCTDFETDPFAEGWTHGKRSQVRDRDEWEWGVPAGNRSGFDPDRAHSGERVFGMDISGRGEGQYEHTLIGFATTPAINVGRYTDVRLQYWRWLTVEDGRNDQAVILANGSPVWQNRATSDGARPHVDREWVFHDVPLGDSALSGAVQLSFELVSNHTTALGGWTLDSLCVVARPGSVCGDGMVSGAEQCDRSAGNSDLVPDACRTTCRLAGCGDGVRDVGEMCDDGNLDDGDGCSAQCEEEEPLPVPAGCAASGTPGVAPGGGGLWLLVLVVAAGVGAPRARRRRAGMRR